MYATVASVSVVGLTAHPVQVEVDIADGLPVFTIVGLPDATVQEARERVKSAIRNAGFHFPAHRITVNLAPADLRKEGAFFDLPVAVGILKASGQLEACLEGYVFLGELSLEGTLRPVHGVLPAVAGLAAADGTCTYVVPRQNVGELALLEGTRLLPSVGLADVGRPSSTDRWSRLSQPMIHRREPSIRPWTSPTSRDRRRPSGPWRLPRPEGTISCSRVRQGRARRCLHNDCQGSCHR